MITFFGLVGANGCYWCNEAHCECLGTPTPTPGFDMEGRRIFEISNGNGFFIVIEAKPGSAGFNVGSFVPPPTPNSSTRPDLQIESTQNLGNGSTAICDTQPQGSGGGGVPGITPPDFGPGTSMNGVTIADALIDFACRFEAHSPTSDPCTSDPGGGPGAISGVLPSGSKQFCDAVGVTSDFPVGYTYLTAQVRDAGQNIGPQVQIVVHRLP